MNRLATARLFEAIFRNRLLFILPFLVITGFGAYLTFTTLPQYRSAGTLFTSNSSFVADRTGLGGTENLYSSPAGFATADINGLMGTDVFLESVLIDADIELAPPGDRGLQYQFFRSTADIFPSNDNLVVVSVTIDEPIIAQALASAIIDRYLEFQIDRAIEESQAASEFFQGLESTIEDEVEEAEAALNTFMGEVGVTAADDLTPTQALAMGRLTEAEAAASARLADVRADIAAAELQSLQARTDVEQAFTVLDVPAVPDADEAGLTSDIIQVMAFAVFGLAIAAIGPVVASILDRSVLFSAELDHLPIEVVPVAHSREVAASAKAAAKKRKASAAAAPVEEPVPEPAAKPANKPANKAAKKPTKKATKASGSDARSRWGAKEAD